MSHTTKPAPAPAQCALYGRTPPAVLPLRETAAYRVQANAGACNLVELLATLIRGPNASPTAERLVEAFPSAHALSRAKSADLMSVRGIGGGAAATLCAAFELARRAHVEDPFPIVRAPADAAALFLPHLLHKDQEYLYVVLLNTRNRVMGDPVEVYHGSLNTSLIRVGELFRDAIRANAAALIVAHNHPSGDPAPSPEDVAVTRAIREAGKLLDVDVLDHLIFGGERFVSLKERGLGFDAAS